MFNHSVLSCVNIFCRRQIGNLSHSKVFLTLISKVNIRRHPGTSQMALFLKQDLVRLCHRHSSEKCHEAFIFKCRESGLPGATVHTPEDP